MDHTEILKKAIEKARNNGWNPVHFIDLGWEIHDEKLWFGDEPEDFVSIYDFIFSHSFAKAFWGEEEVMTILPITLTKDITELSALRAWELDHVRKAWQHHLQQMVLEENPIQYLGRFI